MMTDRPEFTPCHICASNDGASVQRPHSHLFGTLDASPVNVSRESYYRTLAELSFVWASGKEHATDTVESGRFSTYKGAMEWMYDLVGDATLLCFRDWHGTELADLDGCGALEWC
jgi:hypothetical protein